MKGKSTLHRLAVLVATTVMVSSTLARTGVQFAPMQEWRGAYVCAQGRTPARLLITQISGSQVLGRFTFVVSGWQGEYEVRATASGVGQQRMEFVPTRWIVPLQGFTPVGLAGEVSADGRTFSGVVTHPSCSAFELSTSSPIAAAPIQPPSTAATPTPVDPGTSSTAATPTVETAGTAALTPPPEPVASRHGSTGGNPQENAVSGSPVASNPTAPPLDAQTLLARVREAYEATGVVALKARMLDTALSVANEYGGAAPSTAVQVHLGLDLGALARGIEGPAAADVFILTYGTQKQADELFTRVSSRRSAFDVPQNAGRTSRAWKPRADGALAAGSTVLVQVCRHVVIGHHYANVVQPHLTRIQERLIASFDGRECQGREASPIRTQPVPSDALVPRLQQFYRDVGVPDIPWAKGRVSMLAPTLKSPLFSFNDSKWSPVGLAAYSSFESGSVEVFAYESTPAAESALKRNSAGWSSGPVPKALWRNPPHLSNSFEGLVQMCNVVVRVFISGLFETQRSHLQTAGPQYLQAVAVAAENLACR